MTREEIKKILDNHKLWLEDNGGEKADLLGADLSGARLLGADLRDAKYSILSIFKINFSGLSDILTLELMRHDAEFCGVESITAWVNGGGCPYAKMERDFMFNENKTLWVEGAPRLRGVELWRVLASEKNIKISV